MTANPIFQGNNEEFIAIPELARSDAEVTLNFLLENDVRFLKPVNDPWFKANEPILSEDQGVRGHIVYNKMWSRRAPASVLGCTSQYQFVSARFTLLPTCLINHLWWFFGVKHNFPVWLLSRTNIDSQCNPTADQPHACTQMSDMIGAYNQAFSVLGLSGKQEEVVERMVRRPIEYHMLF